MLLASSSFGPGVLLLIIDDVIVHRMSCSFHAHALHGSKLADLTMNIHEIAIVLSRKGWAFCMGPMCPESVRENGVSCKELGQVLDPKSTKEKA